MEILNSYEDVSLKEFVIGIINGIFKVFFYDFVYYIMWEYVNVKYIIKEDSFDGLFKELVINVIDFIVVDWGIVSGI